MRPPKEIYRNGDLVRIVTPQIFIRCGYLYNHTEVMNSLDTRDNEKLIRGFLNKFDIQCTGGTYARIRAVLAYAKIGQTGYGNRNRSIYTETVDFDKDDLFLVRDKNCVKTGTYYGPGGDYELYEPGGLDKAATHVILTVEGCHTNKTTAFKKYKIEAKNVERKV